MPNPDVFFGILQGYGEASHARALQDYQEEQDRRKTLANYYLQESRNPSRLQASQEQMATNFLRVVQTPGHKKLDKDLENVRVEDIARVKAPWMGGQTQREIPLAPSPIPSDLGAGGTLPVIPQLGALLGIQAPPVAPPAMAGAPQATHPAAPSSISAPVPPQPAGFTPTRSAFYTPEEQAQMKASAEEQLETAKMTAQWKAKLQASDMIAQRLMEDDPSLSKGEARERADQVLGVKLPKSATPPNMGVVRGYLNGQRVIADRDPKTGKLYFQGQELTGGFTPDQSTHTRIFRDADSSTGYSEASLNQREEVIGIARGIQPTAAQVGTMTTRQIHKLVPQADGSIQLVPVTETTERTPIGGGPAEAPIPPPSAAGGGPPVSTLPGGGVGGAKGAVTPATAAQARGGGLGPGQGGTVGARALAPDQVIKEGQRGRAYATTLERMADVLRTAQDPKFNFNNFFKRAKLQTVTDPSGLTRTIVANVADLSGKEAKFAADYNSLAEDINILRSAFGANISRGEQMLHILQSQRGQLMGNPKVFQEQLRNSLQSAISQIGPIQQGLSRAGKPMELSDGILKAYLIQNGDDEQKALQALKRDGFR